MSRTVCQEIIADMGFVLPTTPGWSWLLPGHPALPLGPAPARRGGIPGQVLHRWSGRVAQPGVLPKKNPHPPGAMGRATDATGRWQ